MSDNIIHLNEAALKGELKNLVRNSVDLKIIYSRHWTRVNYRGSSHGFSSKKRLYSI